MQARLGQESCHENENKVEHNRDPPLEQLYPQEARRQLAIDFPAKTAL